MPEQPYTLSVHCHYYQPPRGNPFSAEPLIEPDAAPYPNWNARITAECYQPNAAIGNYKHVSFNLGESLAEWLEKNALETYHAFIHADSANMEQFNAGSAIAQPIDHTILPLARREDKITQVRWGKAVFAHRFGRLPTGIWLPEMAVDLETLEVLAEEGIEWTILTESQIEGKRAGSGLYRVNLPNGKTLKVFVRDEGLSNDIAFSLGHFGGAGRWARQVLVPRKRESGPLTLIATDGETFGHHWPGEEQFLHWLLTYEARAAGYEVMTLERYAAKQKATETVVVRNNTSWSCSHGVSRWATGCGCTPGDSTWKGAMRRAMDNLRFELDHIYYDELKAVDSSADPIGLREGYIKVALGSISSAEFLKSQEVDANKTESNRLMKLVEAQFYRQRIYTSCAFFFPDLDALSTRYGIANAAYAIKLTKEATENDLLPSFRRDLSIASGPDWENGQRITGAEILDQVQSEMPNSNNKHGTAPRI